MKPKLKRLEGVKPSSRVWTRRLLPPPPRLPPLPPPASSLLLPITTKARLRARLRQDENAVPSIWTHFPTYSLSPAFRAISRGPSLPKALLQVAWSSGVPFLQRGAHERRSLRLASPRTGGHNCSQSNRDRRYLNPNGDLVIRRRPDEFEQDDVWVVVGQTHVCRLVERIITLYGFSSPISKISQAILQRSWLSHRPSD